MRRSAVCVALLVSALALSTPALATPQKAIDLVQQFSVQDPTLVEDAVLAWEKQVSKMEPPEDSNAEFPPPITLKEPIATTTIGALSNAGHLAQTLGIEGLERGDWKAKKKGNVYVVKHLHTRNDATIAPCWDVDLKSGEVIPHNDLARVYHQQIEDPESYYFAQALMADRLRPVTSHLNAYRLSLAGAALGMFAYNAPLDGEGNEILGWLIDHAGADDYVAIFQWRVGSEAFNARWRVDMPESESESLATFMRRSHRVAVDNLNARQLTTDIGTFGVKRNDFIISPTDYDATPMLPRTQRLSGALKKTCKSKKQRKACDALHTIIENEPLVQATRTLVASQLSVSYCSEADLKRDWTCPKSSAAHQNCASEGLCKWTFSAIDKKNFEVAYLYESADAELAVTFQVHTSGALAPLDEHGAWVLRAIGYDHGDHTTLVEPPRQVAFFNPESHQAHAAMVIERVKLEKEAAKQQTSAVNIGEAAGREFDEQELQDAIYSSPTVDNLTQCLESEYERTGSILNIKVNVHFTLETNGLLKRVRTDAWSLELDTCLRGIFNTIKLKPFDGIPRNVTYPFEFG